MVAGSPLRLRIVVDNPVDGVLHSLHSKDNHPLEPKRAKSGSPLAFDLAIRVAPGPRFLGDQMQREGKERRFVYVRVGQSAGDHFSPWSRRMKIDIHDIPQAMIDEALDGDAVIELRVDGTGKDGTPSCATVKPVVKRVVG